MDDRLEFFAWGWIKDAFWYFRQAIDYLMSGIQCLWWASCSVFEYVMAKLTSSPR
jgi:hypothetical protein